MPFVQAPRVHDWQPGAVHFVQAVPQRTGCPLKNTGVGGVKLIAFSFEQTTGFFGLLHAGGGQVDIGPASEAIVKIPGGFAVANENEFVHGAGFGAEVESGSFAGKQPPF